MSRKKAFNLLSLCLLAVLFYSCGSNAFKGIADDSSQEACRYEVTKNLDSGNWDAVLNSSCADSMQKGAAYFGRAGFDIKDVINRLSEASEEEKDLNIYLKALVPKVTEQTLNDLSMAKSKYGKVPQEDPHYKDAQFYISLVDTSNSLSLMKIVIDSDGDGAISNCDINGNGVPDDADATACALMATNNLFCTYTDNNNNEKTFATYTSSDVTIKGKNYKGLTITIPNETGTSDLACLDEGSSQKTYKKLLYCPPSTNCYLVTTTSDMCDNWPCPIEQNGNPLDLVSAIDQSIDGALNSLGNALPSGVQEDVTQAINEIRQNACGGDNTCTSQEISDYIQNYLSTQQ
jgi:hypothetical protein